MLQADSLLLTAREAACKARDPGSIPRLGRFLGEGKGYYPVQYSHLENSMDREAWWATVQGVTKSHTRLSDFDLHPYD